MRELILSDLKLQDYLNEIITPNWKAVREEKDFLTALLSEIYELIDCYHYKFWKLKDQSLFFRPKDEKNVKVELIDTLHFLNSVVILRLIRISENYIDVADALLSTPVPLHIPPDAMDVQGAIHFFLETTYNYRDMRPYRAFEHLCRTCGYDPEEVYRDYKVKCALNIYRQKAGYRDETYRKEIDGVEDNHIVFEELAGIDISDIDDLVAEIEKILSGVQE